MLQYFLHNLDWALSCSLFKYSLRNLININFNLLLIDLRKSYVTKKSISAVSCEFVT